MPVPFPRILPALLMVASVAGPASAQWQPHGSPVCTAANDQDFPVSVSDGSGGVIVAWTDNRSGTDLDVYAQHILSTGAIDPAWPATGRALCVVANEQADLAIVSDGASGAIVAWDDFRNGANYDIYAQHVLSTGAVDAAWPANGRALCTATGQQFYPTIASDRSGGAIVAWSDIRSGTNYDIYAMRVLSTGAVDPAWPVNGRLVCGAPVDQFFPVSVSDGVHGAILAWSDSRSGSSFDIYAQHVLATGVVDPVWPANGRALCTAIDDQADPAIVSDGGGGAVVAWDDHRNGLDYDIFAQHVLATGATDTDWPMDGAPVCSAVDDQIVPTMISDEAGGALIAWDDARNGADADIFAMHLNALGQTDPSWQSNGLPICTARFDQLYPTLVGDGFGGVIVAWQDARTNFDSDIYAQHVNASGSVDPAWPTDGRAICTAKFDQRQPVIATDRAGGAIVAWTDHRSGTSNDIYAQRVTVSGSTTAVPGLRAPGLGLEAPRPNPMSSRASIALELPVAGPAQLAIYDLAGRRVRTLLDGEVLSAGPHVLTWDGRGGDGAAVGSGIYLVRLTASAVSLTRRVTVLR